MAEVSVGGYSLLDKNLNSPSTDASENDEMTGTFSRMMAVLLTVSSTDMHSDVFARRSAHEKTSM